MNKRRAGSLLISYNFPIAHIPIITTAWALINRGFQVTMLDTGFDLEPERMNVVNHLSALPKDKWDERSINTIKENMNPNSEGVNIKCLYGSDYIYRGMDYHQPVKLYKSKMVRSLAKGGLSNIWGASLLPYTERDIVDWPIKYSELEPHYEKVLQLMPFAGFEDDLSRFFPLYGKPQNFNLSNQAQSLLVDLNSRKTELEKQGFFYGHSRLAVNFDKCVYCGMCLYGCPYRLIYSTTETLGHLIKNDNFKYIPNILVEKFQENAQEITIVTKSLLNDKRTEFHGSKAFLAAGTVSSTRILLNTLNALNHQVVFKHSDHFQIPLLRFHKTSGLETEEMHTLTQLYIELFDGTISPNIIHMQIYAYNDLFEKVMKNKFGALTPLLKIPINEFLGRFLIIKGYLHSDISSTIEATLDNSTQNFLTLKGQKNQKAHDALKKIKNKISINKKIFKALPMPLITKLSLPGIGNHSGGTFPMSQKPGAFETDTLGRPAGFSNLHVVDSTIFPTIPATTISYSIMANAHRIASEA